MQLKCTIPDTLIFMGEAFAHSTMHFVNVHFFNLACLVYEKGLTFILTYTLVLWSLCLKFHDVNVKIRMSDLPKAVMTVCVM